MSEDAAARVGRLMTAKALPGRGDELAAALVRVAGTLRGFPGCELYVINQDRADPDTVYAFEVWSDEAAVNAALEAARTAANPPVSMAAVMAMVDGPMRRVDLVPLGGVGLAE
ncbi:putative quinol monooxygenase [Rugosimonospora africana]|uniref:putative quinol monooxygenase n=1 Tax=Rugosimonospora africana TaxID=556532 RepID=UPI0019419C1E|nr:antibiotic biosynthesis monooxygenase family protein [Rugosimonospora africana]